MKWLQRKPKWCPHPDCIFKRRVMDALCAGELSKPKSHGKASNTHRICITNVLPNNEVLDLQVNKGDLYHFRRICDAIDARGIGIYFSRATFPLDLLPDHPILGSSKEIRSRAMLLDACKTMLVAFDEQVINASDRQSIEAAIKYVEQVIVKVQNKL